MFELSKPVFLSYERFRLTLEVTTLMVLPPYKGGIFRGAFGNAFRQIVCPLPRGDCPDCLLKEKCLYVAFFEPPPPPDFPDALRFSRAPAPYVLNPPISNRQAFHPHDQLDFELVLMGRAIDALPYFVYTFMDMGKRGLGRERGNYHLQAVDLIRGSQATRISAFPLGRWARPKTNGPKTN